MSNTAPAWACKKRDKQKILDWTVSKRAADGPTRALTDTALLVSNCPVA